MQFTDFFFTCFMYHIEITVEVFRWIRVFFYFHNRQLMKTSINTLMLRSWLRVCLSLILTSLNIGCMLKAKVAVFFSLLHKFCRIFLSNINPFMCSHTDCSMYMVFLLYPRYLAILYTTGYIDYIWSIDNPWSILSLTICSINLELNQLYLLLSS